MTTPAPTPTMKLPGWWPRPRTCAELALLLAVAVLASVTDGVASLLASWMAVALVFRAAESWERDLHLHFNREDMRDFLRRAR